MSTIPEPTDETGEPTDETGEPTGPPASPPPERPKRRGLIFGLIAGIAVFIVGALVAGYLLTNDDGKRARPKPGPGEIFLESASSRGRDAFTRSVSTGHPVTGTTTTTLASTPSTPARGTVVSSASGSTPALYGGSQNNASCDPERLIQFLDANSSKARAFAGVLGITTANIPSYVRSLTPVLLTRDTRVTNHGYYNGRATSLRSILQAGTAVLVDGDGIPRVKCGCGNPLSPPMPTRVPPVYTGPRWPGFEPTNTVVVTVDVHVDTFVLVNPSTGDKFTRPAGTAGPEDTPVQIDELCALFPDDARCEAAHPGQPSLGRGDVQATLRWGSPADLDLSVTDPTGAVISYGSRTSPSGGNLDVDANGGSAAQMAAPVENVFWPLGTAPPGQYTVTVKYFASHPGGEGPQAYTLAVLIGGRLVNLAGGGGQGSVVNGTLNAAGEQQSYTFTLGDTVTDRQPEDSVG